MKFRRKNLISTLGLAAILACGAESITAPPTTNPPAQQPPTQQQNRAPVITSIPQATCDENKEYVYNVVTSDLDGDPVSLSFIDKPTYLSFSNNRISGPCPEVSKDSTFSFKIRATDTKNAFAEQPGNPSIKNTSNSYLASPRAENPLVGMQDSTWIFAKPITYNIGDILVADTSKLIPYGNMGRITSISGDKTRATTERATIEEVIKNGTFSFKGTISQANVQSSSFLREGISLAPNSAAQTQSFGINLSNVVLYDFDKNPLTTGDQLVANGRIEVATDFDFKADVQFVKLKNLDFGNKTKITSDITLGSNITGLASKLEIPLGEIYFTPFMVPSPIGGLPIPVTPKGGFYLIIDPTRVNPLSVRAKQESSLEMELKYDGNWNHYATFSSNFEISNPVFNGEWDLSVSATPRLTFLIGGVLGASVGVGADVGLEASSTDWRLLGRLWAGLGVSMEIFSKKVAAYFKKLIEYEKVLAEGKQEIETVTDTIQPGPEGKDAFVRNATWPDGTHSYYGFGNDSLIYFETNYHAIAGEEQQSLLEFPLSRIPSNSTITSAKLRLYGNGVTNHLTDLPTVTVSKLLSSWDESTVKWNTKPSKRDITSIDFVNEGSLSWYEFNVTSTVQAWINGEPNYGFDVLTGENEVYGKLYSSDHADAAKRPMLIVTYH